MDEDAARRHGAGSQQGPGGGADDLVSALPEDLLLQVLVRLRCARAAARTSILSRRWRGLWTRLPDLIFRDVPVPWIQAALSSLHGGVSLLDIAFSSLQAAVDVSLSIHDRRLGEKVAAGVPLLLHAAAALSPAEFHLALPLGLGRAHADLPGFHRATSIQLCALDLRLTLPPRSTFSKLEQLSLSGCCVDLAALVRRCPRLRVLRVTKASLAGINIQSESLQKLFVRTNEDCRGTDCVNIEAPMLKQLMLNFVIGAELSVSLVAPILEKVSWGCLYTITKNKNVGLGPWGLSKLRLYAAQSVGQRLITGGGEDACLQLSNVHVLSLQMLCCGWLHAELNFVQQIEKHLVTDFSVLELTMVYDNHMEFVRHVFGPFVLHLLGMHRICTGVRRLQIQFLGPEVKGKCSLNCLCDEPKNWRSKNISLINLEEVEIKGFEGDDHEFDFLRVILRCAPILKRMSVWVSDKATAGSNRCTEIQEVFKEYPFVECNLVQC